MSPVMLIVVVLLPQIARPPLISRLPVVRPVGRCASAPWLPRSVLLGVALTLGETLRRASLVIGYALL
jgi:hypothetical protein